MKVTRHEKRQGLVAVIAFVACVSSLWAAGTTTNSLVVNGDSEFRGDLKVVDGSTGSAPTNGLILYYSFSTNTTPVVDDSGNNHTGAVSGASWTTNGQSQGAYRFDGTGDYVTVTGYKGILGNSPVSVSLWFKTSSSVIWTIMYVWGNDAVNLGDNALTLYTNHLAALSANATYNIYGTRNVVDGQWHHAVVTFDGRYKYLYLDNEQEAYVDGVTGVNVVSASDLHIGSAGDGATYCFNGSIDEFRIYDRALSASEVDGLYLHDAHLTAGTARFETGVSFVKPLGDLLMGVYTNSP